MPEISAGEYLDRQRRLRERAADRGLDAVVAISRGGGTHDRTADVLWLAGLAASQPFVPDLMPLWRAAGHAAVVVAVDGPCTAIVEADELQARPAADTVVVAGDVIAAVGDALASLGARSVGVLGGDVLTVAWHGALAERLPAATLNLVDDLALALRRHKSPAEQTLLRAAGRLGSRAMAAALDAARPGAAEAEVAAAFFDTVVAGGGAVYDVVISSGEASATLGPSGGAAGVARWTTRTLRTGDLLRLDAYGSVGGYLFDLARTTVVGNEPTDEQAALIAALEDAVTAGIEALGPGVPLAHVARRCEQVLAASEHAQRHGVPGHTMSGFWGHGLGLGWEPPWLGPHSPEVAEPGMCMAIERRAAVPTLGGAQFEDDVLITAEGYERLTSA